MGKSTIFIHLSRSGITLKDAYRRLYPHQIRPIIPHMTQEMEHCRDFANQPTTQHGQLCELPETENNVVLHTILAIFPGFDATGRVSYVLSYVTGDAGLSEEEFARQIDRDLARVTSLTFPDRLSTAGCDNVDEASRTAGLCASKGWPVIALGIGRFDQADADSYHLFTVPGFSLRSAFDIIISNSVCLSHDLTPPDTGYIL